MGYALFVQIVRDNAVVAEHRFESEKSRTIKIGRLASAKVRLEDTKVARIHAVVELSGAEPQLVDMGSSGGTLRNGAKVQKCALAHGDRIAMGDTELVIGIDAPGFVSSSSSPATLSPATQAPVSPDAGGAAAPAAVSTQATATPTPASVQAAPAAAPPAPDPIPAPTPAPAPTIPTAGQNSVPGSDALPMPGDAGALGDQSLLPKLARDRMMQAAIESRPDPRLPSEETLSAENRVLEMRVYWGEALLAMHHYKDPKKITIGERGGTDFFISSEGLPVEAFPIVRTVDGEYVLTFCKRMQGEVEINGERLSLDRLYLSNAGRSDEQLDQSYNLHLGVNSRAILHWGGATFALRFVPPPVQLPAEGIRWDLPYLNSFLFSAFAHVVLIFTCLVYPYDVESLKDELFEKKSDRFASLILEERKQTKSNKEMLEKLRKSVEEKKVKNKPPEPLKVAKAPAQNDVVKKAAPQKSEQQKKAEVKQKFAKLFSGGGGGLLGGGGGGSLSGSLANVIGTAGSSSATAGLRGLGIRGSGPSTGGGVGTSRGVGGIGTAGRLGGGGLAYGKIGGIGKKQDRKMVTLETPVVMGALPADVIKRIIRENRNQVRYCYEVELQRNQNLEGRIMMTWVIGRDGRVTTTKVKKSSMSNPRVESCIRNKIKGWRFPPPAGGGVVEVNYPFVFKAS